MDVSPSPSFFICTVTPIFIISILLYAQSLPKSSFWIKPLLETEHQSEKKNAFIFSALP